MRLKYSPWIPNQILHTLLLSKDTVHVHRSTTPLSETVSSSNYNNMDATCTGAQDHLVSLASLIRSGVGNMSCEGLPATVHCRLCITVLHSACVLLHCTLHVYYCTALCMCVTALHSACVLLYCTLHVCYCTALCMCITVLHSACVYCTLYCMCVTVLHSACVLLHSLLHVCYCTALCMCVTALSTACVLLYCTLHVCYILHSVYYCTVILYRDFSYIFTSK